MYCMLYQVITEIFVLYKNYLKASIMNLISFGPLYECEEIMLTIHLKTSPTKSN